MAHPEKPDVLPGLADYLVAVQMELAAATAQLERQRSPYAVGSVELQMDVSLQPSSGAEAGSRIRVVSTGRHESAEANSPQRLVLRLVPREDAAMDLGSVGALPAQPSGDGAPSPLPRAASRPPQRG